MTAGWKAKRFWSEVSVSQTEGGFAVHLDARRVMTPGKIPLTLPSRAMAEAVAAEWAAQTGEIAPLTMPVTRAANSAIERVTPQRAEVAAMLSAYAETDLICYRAAGPAALVARQAVAWDPLLAWAADALDAPLIATVGVLPVDQPPASLARLADFVSALDAFQLTGLHDLVAISGSLIIALAVTSGRLAPDQAWAISRIDEEWQIAQWGADEEAAALAAYKHGDFLRAAQFWAMSQPN
ncbi:ATP12 family chaperone protein [Roseicyclus sp.]|uniref:ATP12 family chaperone protein n=1 Tax=Roseicyclus sp. TaxID=1914329 RepID=UPI003F6CA1A2